MPEFYVGDIYAWISICVQIRKTCSTVPVTSCEPCKCSTVYYCTTCPPAIAPSPAPAPAPSPATPTSTPTQFTTTTKVPPSAGLLTQLFACLIKLKIQAHLLLHLLASTSSSLPHLLWWNSLPLSSISSSFSPFLCRNCQIIFTLSSSFCCRNCQMDDCSGPTSCDSRSAQ